MQDLSAASDPSAPSAVTRILLLEGDAESRLLADAQTACEAVSFGRTLSLERAWATRPDWLTATTPVTPRALIDAGAVPDTDLRTLLAVPPRLVIFSLLPAVTLPALRHRDGGTLLAPQGLRATWTPQAAALIAADCVEEPPMAPADAATVLEPLIVRLQDQGACVALCTAFRHVQTPPGADGRLRAQATREILRRLNLEVARLSQRTGCFVLDLDRPLAHEGGAMLGADYRGGDGRAAELALDELAALLLEALPDELMPLESP